MCKSSASTIEKLEEMILANFSHPSLSDQFYLLFPFFTLSGNFFSIFFILIWSIPWTWLILCTVSIFFSSVNLFIFFLILILSIPWMLLIAHHLSCRKIWSDVCLNYVFYSNPPSLDNFYINFPFRLKLPNYDSLSCWVDYLAGQIWLGQWYINSVQFHLLGSI